MHKLFEEAEARATERGGNYNAGTIKRSDYWIFGEASLVHEVHKEALRICSWTLQGRTDKMREHLVDLVVYAKFLSDFLDEQEAVGRVADRVIKSLVNDPEFDGKERVGGTEWGRTV